MIASAPTLQSANGTIEDVMSFFRVSRRTVWRWIEERRISYWHQGRNLAFGEEAVIEFRLSNLVRAAGSNAAQARESARREWREHLLLRQNNRKEELAA